MSDSNRKVNVAVVGLGFMGVTHLRAYLDTPGARVAAVCDAVRLPVNGVLQGVAGNIKKSDDMTESVRHLDLLVKFWSVITHPNQCF